MNEVAVNSVMLRIGDVVRVGSYVGELIQIHNEDLVTVDLGEDFDDGTNDGFAEVNPKHLVKIKVSTSGSTSAKVGPGVDGA